MARLIDIKTFSDERGSLSVIEDEVGFAIKRMYYIYDVPKNKVRGQHGHLENQQAMIALNGSCRVEVVSKNGTEVFCLERPDQCLLVDVGCWKKMYDFSVGSVLLVLASHKFDKNDYFYERPK